MHNQSPLCILQVVLLEGSDIQDQYRQLLQDTSGCCFREQLSTRSKTHLGCHAASGNDTLATSRQVLLSHASLGLHAARGRHRRGKVLVGCNNQFCLPCLLLQQLSEHVT